MTEALSSLYERVRRETALRFPGQEDGLVFSCGQAEGCTAVLIGEAPGEQEVKMKRPFSGKAGKNLGTGRCFAQSCDYGELGYSVQSDLAQAAVQAHEAGASDTLCDPCG